MSEPVALVLVTRRDCGLCEEMEEVVEVFVAGGEAVCETVDVDGDPELVARYGDEVPVLLVNGRKAFKYRVDDRSLRRRIRSEKRRAMAGRLRSLVRGASR